MESSRVSIKGRLGEQTTEKLYLDTRGNLVGTLFSRTVYPHRVEESKQVFRTPSRTELLTYIERRNNKVTRRETRKRK